MFQFSAIDAVPDVKVDGSTLQNSMLFELSVARTEMLLGGHQQPDWKACLKTATDRQKRHFDAKLPAELSSEDIALAEWSAQNLLKMLSDTAQQYPQHELVRSPFIPGLGWISSGVGDFSLGPILIEVKHTDRNFIAGDFRQILIYWLLRYAASIEQDGEVWTDCLLLNPRRNSALLINFDYLIRSASPNLSRLEVYELLRSIVGSGAEAQ